MTGPAGWKPGEKWIAIAAVLAAFSAPVIAAVVAWYLTAQHPGASRPETSGGTSVSHSIAATTSVAPAPTTSAAPPSSTTTPCTPTIITLAPGVEVPVTCPSP